MVVSFVVFVVTPNLVYICRGWEKRERTHEAKDANKVSYQFLFLINFVLCVAMQADVNHLWKSKLRQHKEQSSRVYLRNLEFNNCSKLRVK